MKFWNMEKKQKLEKLKVKYKQFKQTLKLYQLIFYINKLSINLTIFQNSISSLASKRDDC